MNSIGGQGFTPLPFNPTPPTTATPNTEPVIAQSVTQTVAPSGPSPLTAKPVSQTPPGNPLQWKEFVIHPDFTHAKFKGVLETSSGGGAIAVADLAWLYTVTISNKNFNAHVNAHKRANTPLYQEHKVLLDSLSHLSHITQRTGEFTKLTQTAAMLQHREDPIDETEKITPNQMHLVDSFSHSPLLSSSTIDLGLGAMADDDPHKRALSQIKNSLDFWKQIKQDAMTPYKNGDIMFDTANIEHYSNGEARLHAGVRFATGKECYHAAIFQNSFDREIGEEVPSRSHVVAISRTDPLEIGELSFIETFRLNIPNLLLTPIPGVSEHDLTTLYTACAREAHDRISRQELTIQNGNLPLLAVFVGERFDAAKQRSVEEMPNRNMCCSEFAVYETLMALRLFEQELKSDISRMIKTQSSPDPVLLELSRSEVLLKPLLPTDRRVVLHPGNFYSLLVEQGFASAVPPHTAVSRIMQTPKVNAPSDLAMQQATFKREEVRSAAWRWW